MHRRRITRDAGFAGTQCHREEYRAEVVQWKTQTNLGRIQRIVFEDVAGVNKGSDSRLGIQLPAQSSMIVTAIFKDAHGFSSYIERQL